VLGLEREHFVRVLLIAADRVVPALNLRLCNAEREQRDQRVDHAPAFSCRQRDVPFLEAHDATPALGIDRRPR